MSGDDREKKLDNATDSISEASGDALLTNEAEAGRKEWADREKEKQADLRKRSGITSDFGKPVISEAKAPMGMPAKADTASVENQSIVTLEPVVIVGELPYHGEPEITRQVEAKCQKAAKDETFESIAKSQLGTDASKKEIDAYIKELARVNELGEPPQIREGQLLKRPGHTGDGGFVTLDEKGEKTTRWPNGNLRVDHADQSFRLIERLPRNAFRETHGGSDRPEENFILIRDRAGKYKLDDGTNLGMEPFERVKPIDYSQSPSHKELERLAEEKISDPERLAKFRADMLRFEDRIKTLRGDGLPGFEIDATYEQIGRLLKAEGDKPLSPEQRVVLAEQVLSQAASPKSIDQGHHNTCNVATIESRLYTQDPTRAAQMVTDVALTGKFTGYGDVEVTINPNSLQPDKDASRNPPRDGDRSHASQVFQVTAVNMAYQMKKADGHWEGKYVYEQYKPGEKDGAGNTVGRPPADGGQRLIDYSKTPPEEKKDFNTNKPIRRPDISDDDIIKVICAITDESKFDPILIDHKVNAQDNQLTRKVDSEHELNATLLEAVRNGKLPIIVSVNSHIEPFWSDSDGQLAAGSSGAHVVTITRYDAGPPARVGIDNQWGTHSDHSSDLQHMVPVHELQLAMAYPFEVADKRNADKVVQAIKADVDAGTATTAERLQYLRLTSKNTHGIEYRDTLIQCMLDEQKRFKKSQEQHSAADHERAMKTFKLMLQKLDRFDQEDVINRLLQDSPDDPALLAERHRIKEMPLGGIIAH